MPSGARPATVPRMTTTTPISSTVAALRAAGFVGHIVEPQHPDYDQARASWNGAVDRRPAAVAYAGDADDVAAAIGAARALALPFTIRAGGLTLGGGLGWLMRHHGLTIDSLRAAEVVLAGGRMVRASATEHPDLLWALRGGGGDFAAVTCFEFDAHRVGPMVLAGMLVYPWHRAREAMQAARALMDRAPDQLTTFVALITAPPQPPFPPELWGRRAAVVAVAWSGDLAEGERVLAPLRTGHPPALDLVAPMPYVALQSMLDETAPHGWQFYDRLTLASSTSTKSSP